ncbi:hypothetical protein DT019_02805 [Streptomyces sp. SDr-06]|uniref:hypothetical protein n=1 Tax=Streptomyces sp. SDr-06 TaxID=2267702 RepID=UPI000DEBF70D|nr:hypothetical protein [Streptomyces sp. SDr-06]RCH70432.1 hypothetical protein DT019_02805 [Streptomyces sp. SDr-06]
MAINPNWPIVEEGWGSYWNGSSGAPWDRYTEVTPSTRGRSSIQRGRQYELDQVRSGEYQTVLANKDGSLDPANTGGPFYGHIAPYQSYRKRAMWPPSINLLSQIQATGGDLGGYAVGASAFNADIFSDTDSSGSAIVTASATAWQGANVLQASIPSGTTAPAKICRTPQTAALPGQTYTMQMRVRNVTAATSLQVKAGIGWFLSPNATPASSFTYGSTVTLTGSPTAAWTQIIVTATAPAGAMGMDVGVMVAATAAATCSVQVDGWQLERGSTASAWVQPGVWYPMFEGFTERWPAQWTHNGTYGTTSPVCVDAMSLLSQVQLSDPLTQEINSHSPRFLFKLDDPQNSNGASDATGNYPQAQVAVSKYGAGSLTFGTQITATNPATGVFTGSGGTVVAIANANPGQFLTGPATYLKLTSSGITGPANPALWVRTLAFCYTGPAIAGGAYMWSCMDGQRSGGSPSGSLIAVYLDTSGHPSMDLRGPTGAGGTYVAGGATNCADGNWHFLIFGYNTTTQQVVISQDGALAAFYGSIPSTYTPTGLISDSLGGYVDATNGGGTTANYQGDLAFAAEFADWNGIAGGGAVGITNLYNAWKNAFAGESSDTRYKRILGYAGWTALSNLQTGLTTSMGPAEFGGQDGLSALQGVVDTENGSHFIGTDGRVNFRSRGARYNSLTPMYIFGERTDLGEWPYEDCQLDYDSTHLANRVTITQQTPNQQFVAQDSASITAYFPRTLTRTINSSSAAECQDAANYLLSRYKQPAIRVSSIKFHPSANPALWPVLLSLELGTRVRVMRRPPSPASPIQIECFVEAIQWDMDDQAEAFCTLQCSPVDLTPYAIFSAWHTTLKTTVASGVSSITVNNSQDNTNPLAAQLPAGTQIVLGQNTANQETITISAVGATSTGWTSAVLTLTAPTTKSHTAGDLINEVLPAGITDPTTWDAASAFDATAFAY